LFFRGCGAFSAAGISGFDHAIATAVGLTLAADTQRAVICTRAIACKCLHCAALPIAEHHHGGHHKNSQFKIEPSSSHESPPESELSVEQF